MGRLRAIAREQLDGAGQEIWDRVMAGRTGGAGPYGTLMHAPEMAECYSRLEGYFRERGTLAKADKEMIILAVARELGARFPWSRHEIRARQVGVRSEALETLRGNGSTDALTAHERIVIELARALVRQRYASDELFSQAEAELGAGPLVEAVGLVGHYNFICMVARTFNLEVAPGTVTF
jgi:alkylhydroperoxidase family enzyme